MSILEEAQKIIYGDREQTYGDPGKNIRMIADLWAVWLGHPVSVEDVCQMMVLLKIARLKNSPKHLDTQIDICGYEALLERIQKGDKAPVLIKEGSRIDCIQKIDANAALWLMENIPALMAMDRIPLRDLFTWDRTPQGFDYWLSIENALKEYGYDRR